MKIFFQTKKTELSPQDKSSIARRIEGLNKFFSFYANTYIDIEKTHTSHNGQNLYYVSIRIEDAPYNYFAEEYQDGIRKAFDNAYMDIYRIIRKDRSKSRTVMRSAGRAFKRIFKRKAR